MRRALRVGVPGGWTRPSSLEVDADKCEASYVLEPGVASRLNHDGYCDDYEEHADQGPAFFPNLEYLVVEGRGGAREWRGWDAVAQFKRAWWSGWCFMRVREQQARQETAARRFGNSR